MPKIAVFTLFYIATFLQAGTYGLTFMLPKLFSNFGANEKYVGAALLVTTFVTLFSVYYSGHLTDRLGRMLSLSLSGIAIAISLFLFGNASELGLSIVLASALLGFGWGVFYTLGPVVLTRITAPEERVRVFSLNSVFMMAGFGLSPVMASILESRGFSVADAFFIMSVFCVCSAVLFLLLKPSVNKLSAGFGAEQRSSLGYDTIKRIFRSPARTPVIMVCLGASIFAGMNNFQTVFADTRGMDYANFFLAYTITVVICRILLAGFSGGKSPYKTIALLQYVMFASIVLFIFSGNTPWSYILVAVLFGIGYGASYPILAAMTANDAQKELIPQTLQLFALTYFIGIFGFPLVAGWIIVELTVNTLLIGIATLALIEASMALKKALK
ncbi:MAG: MFS transporter [Gammaproteobacteria bacterium]|nr:MFS transporter [Gammaproteobacteria bacterium]